MTELTLIFTLSMESLLSMTELTLISTPNDRAYSHLYSLNAELTLISTPNDRAYSQRQNLVILISTPNNRGFFSVLISIPSNTAYSHLYSQWQNLLSPLNSQHHNLLSSSASSSRSLSSFFLNLFRLSCRNCCWYPAISSSSSLSLSSSTRGYTS